MWARIVIPITVTGCSFISWALVQVPSTSVFGILVAASGTMLAMTVATQAWHSSVLDSWLTFYGGIATRAITDSEKFDQATYETGIRILRERAEIFSFLKSACYVILASLILSLSALFILLIFSHCLQAYDVVNGLFGACVASLAWAGVLLALIVHHAVRWDSKRCRRTIDDLDYLLGKIGKAKGKKTQK